MQNKNGLNDFLFNKAFELLCLTDKIFVGN